MLLLSSNSKYFDSLFERARMASTQYFIASNHFKRTTRSCPCDKGHLLDRCEKRLRKFGSRQRKLTIDPNAANSKDRLGIDYTYVHGYHGVLSSITSNIRVCSTDSYVVVMISQTLRHRNVMLIYVCMRLLVHLRISRNK